eukprot:SAG11_NODE_1554_length_4695_cov_1.527633_1_plen_78_part_00
MQKLRHCTLRLSHSHCDTVQKVRHHTTACRSAGFNITGRGRSKSLHQLSRRVTLLSRRVTPPSAGRLDAQHSIDQCH